MRYYNPVHNGYTDINFSRTKADVKLVAIDTVASENYGVFECAEFTVRPTRTSLKISNPKGLNLKQRALFNGLG